MKKLYLFFILIFVLKCSAISTMAADFTPALPSENQDVWIERLGEDSYNLLVNGSFEKVNDDGMAVGWDTSHNIAVPGAAFGTKTGNAHTGENFMYISGKAGGRIYVSRIVTEFVPNTSYTFTSYMRHISGDGQLRLNIIFQKASGNTHEPISTLRYPIEADASWTKNAYTFKVPQETTRIIFIIRVDGEAELHTDDVALIGKAKPHIVAGTAFREKLLKEAEIRRKHEKSYNGKWENTGTDILPSNGNFNQNVGSIVLGWGIKTSWSSFIKVAKNVSHDGSDAVELSVPKGNGLKNPYLSQIIPLVGGAEYEVSFRYKNEGGGNAALKLEYYTDRTLPGAQSYGGKHIHGKRTDGWQYVKEMVRVPENATEASLLVRLIQNTESEDAKCYIDDVSLRMVCPPSPLQFSTDSIFYYSDETEGTLSASVNLKFFPAYQNAKAGFTIYDGETAIWEKKGIQSVDGKTEVMFPLSVLKNKEYPYIAKATLYDADGNIAESKTQQIYVYDRPAFLGADGVYMQNGNKPFYPTFAYKVGTDQYEKVKEAGINLVQMGAFLSPDQAVAALDAAQRAGIMGFIALYNGMQPAANHTNIETTISILSDTRVQNHPALFGYGVMDEVFLVLHNPEQDMENSYRLIRQYDKKRPIMTMEAVDNYYEETGKYVDILCIDPYSAANTKRVSTATAKARAATGYKKPVYALLETYYNTQGRWPTPEDGRNNNWQALLAGANAVGYFNIREADENASGASVPIWDARDGGALWNALCTFAEKEKQTAYDHFVMDKTPALFRYTESDYAYSAWVDGQNIYLLLMGFKENAERTVTIPLQSFSGEIQIGAYRAECIAGRNEAQKVSNGNISLTVRGTEVLLYRITPEKPTDFSALHASSFEDMNGAMWAWEAATSLDSLGIMQGKTKWEFAPDEEMTDAEFKDALFRITDAKFAEKKNMPITADEAITLAEEALGIRYAKLDITIALQNAYLRGADKTELLSRGEAAMVLHKVLYLSENPNSLRARFGLGNHDIEEIYESLLLSEDVGESVNSVWYKTDGDYIFLCNMGTETKTVTVPKTGQYVKIVEGVTGDAVHLLENGTQITVSPNVFCIIKVTDTPPAGLYIGSIAEVVPRENVFYTVRGNVAVYGTVCGTWELLHLYTDGETAQVKSDNFVRAFLWDEQMKPVR